MSVLFYRQSLHFLGGMGIVILGGGDPADAQDRRHAAVPRRVHRPDPRQQADPRIAETARRCGWSTWD
jgi:hypothetical protein